MITFSAGMVESSTHAERADRVTAGMHLGTDQANGATVLQVAHPAPGTVWLVTTAGFRHYDSGDQIAVLDT